VTEGTPNGWQSSTGQESDAAQVRRAARGSTLNLAGAGISAIASFGLTALVTRADSQAVAGVFFSATSLFVLLVAIGQLGTTNGLVFFPARAQAIGHPDRTRHYIRAALIPVVCFSMLMSVALFMLASQVSSIISPNHRGLAAESVRVLAVFVPFATTGLALLAATRGLGTMRANVAIEQILRPGLQIAIMAVIVALGLRLNQVWAWGIPYSVACVVAMLWLRRLLSRESKSRSPAKVMQEFWRYTAPRSGVSLAQVAMQRLDIVLVGAIAGAPEAALYTAATRFVVLGQMARNAVSQAIEPHLAAALTNGQRGTVNHLYQVSTAWLMAVSWPVYLVMLVAAPVMLQIFGQDYVVATDVLSILATAMLVATFCGDVDVILLMSGRGSWTLINIGVALALNLGIDLWLIPKIGITGAALGWAVAIVVKCLSALIQVGLVMRIHPVARGTILVGAISVVSFGGVLGVVRAVFSPDLLPMLLGATVACGVYAALIWRARDQIELGAFLAAPLRRVKN